VTPVLTMVIDDSRAMRLILKRIVAQLGFEVVEAGNGKEAMDYLTGVLESGDGAKLPGLALVDWNMPEMNGLDFVTAVRADARLRNMTLMMVTTESEQSQIVRALASGAHEYVIKPFTPDAIIEKLTQLGLVPNGAAV
jgi:two-component system, chemotaxis family, chemotaxis protein CheY